MTAPSAAVVNGSQRTVAEYPLRVRDVEVAFGGVKALSEVNIDVHVGQIHGLIGPNGAGKSTLMDVISGFQRASRGTVELNGARVDATAPHKRARAGLGRTFQGLELFDDLTVADNLSAGLVNGKRPTRAEVEHAAGLLGVQGDLDRLVVSLAHGRRRLVSVARAVVGEPKVLLLDEPAAGLETRETAELGRVLRSLITQENAIVLVDHDMQLVMEVCDTVTVLQLGRVIASGTAAEIRSNPQVRAAYLGEG
jgi:ABC-type branched-subunit amino acid transport system ATPase component